MPAPRALPALMRNDWRPSAGSVRTALAVGPLLVALNVGPSVVSGTFALADSWRVALNFLVPLVVADYSRRRAGVGGGPRRSFAPPPASEVNMSFPVHTKDSAPPAARVLLAGAEKKFGFVPNLLGVLAESPAALEAYLAIADAVAKGRLTSLEREIALLAVSVENRCEYCVAAHSTIAGMAKSPAGVVEAARAGGPIPDARLEALRRFTQAVVATRGRPDVHDLQMFAAAGYDRGHLLEVLAAVAQKTLSNYTNHLAQTPLDDAFAAQRWEAPGVAV